MAEMDALPLETLLAPNGLSDANRLVFDYWQSLRRDGGLPARKDFNPARIGPALSRLCLFDVKPGEYVICRLAGSEVGRGLGMEISGMDIRRYTPAAYQEQRLAVYDRILSGLAMRNTRGATMTTGRQAVWQELALPFGDCQEDGSRQVLLAADFDRPQYGERVVSPLDALGAPLTAAFIWL